MRFTPTNHPGFRTPIASSRTRACLASAVAALALNASLLGLFAMTSRAGGTKGEAPAKIWALAILARTENNQNPVPPTTSPDLAQPYDAVTARPPRKTTHRPSLSERTSAPPVETIAATPLHFYPISEVDRPATPQNDWNLNTAELDTAGIARLVFDVFIDRDGTTVAARIIEPEDLDQIIVDALEAKLRASVASPAVRAGVAVASTRRIELSVLPPIE